jgi:hypothetical protein
MVGTARQRHRCAQCRARRGAGRARVDTGPRGIGHRTT